MPGAFFLRRRALSLAALFLLLIDGNVAFLAGRKARGAALHDGRRRRPLPLVPSMSGEDTDAQPKPKASDAAPKPKVSDGLNAALQEEITSPFRGLRFFVYGAGFLGGSLGGLTALSQLLAGVGGAPSAPAVSQSLQNIVVDFGVVAAAVAGWNFDSKQKDAKTEALKLAQDRRTGQPDESKSAKKLEMLQQLEVMVPVDPTQAPEGAVGLKAKLGDLREGAQQNIVVFASSSSETVKEALIKAQIVGETEFTAKNVLVVPVDLSKMQQKAKGKAAGKKSGKGFGGDPAWLDQGYVAPPLEGTEAQWLKYVTEELEDAEGQGVEGAAKTGIAICVRADGRVARRGLGVPLWADLVDELGSD